MKKHIIISFLSGAILFGSAGVFAGQYIATENQFPIQLNGQNISLQGYNINDETYFRLRDIADKVGGFDVGFADNTIQLAKDGYVYDNNTYQKIYPENDLLYYYPQTNSNGQNVLLPCFNIDSEDAISLNSSIYAEFTEVIHDKSDLEGISYGYYINDNILSLVIRIDATYNDVVRYIAHNIDLNTGSEISNSELIQKCGATESEVLSYIREALRQHIINDFNSLAAYSNRTYNDVFNENLSIYQYALSENCCSIDTPMFINAARHLTTAPTFVEIGGDHDDILNTDYTLN